MAHRRRVAGRVRAGLADAVTIERRSLNGWKGRDVTVVFILIAALVYATALAAIVYGLTAELLPGQSRIGFAALPVSYGQYAAVSVTALLLRLDGPAFAYPFIASVGVFVVGAVVAVTTAV